MMPRRLHLRPPAGFTLIESLMSVLIVSGVLVASLGTLGAIAKTRQTQVDRAAAVHLANQMMAEIMQCHYRDPATGPGGAIGPGPGETDRTRFNDVDDYDGWQSSSPPRYRDGTVMSDYARWRVAVEVRYASLGGPAGTDSVDTGLKRIRVRVTLPSGEVYEMLGTRAAGGVYEQSPDADTTYVTFGGITARVGNLGKTIQGGAHPLNGKAAE